TAAKSSTTVLVSGPSVTARSYAVVRTVAAAPSTSPESSMTAVPGSTRVVASHALVMCRTSSSHGQPDGVPLAVGRYLHGVDHVADEEQSPASRALAAVELAVEVRFLEAVPGLGALLAALVADGDDDPVAVLGHLDLDR